jgi:hypothetical protein
MMLGRIAETLHAHGAASEALCGMPHIGGG